MHRLTQIVFIILLAIAATIFGGIAFGQEGPTATHATEPSPLTEAEALRVARAQISLLQAQLAALQARIQAMSTPAGLASTSATGKAQEATDTYAALESELTDEGCRFDTQQKIICE